MCEDLPSQAFRVRASPVGGSLWHSEHSQGTFDTGFGLDVAEVGGHARSVSDVVEAQLAHQRAVLQQQGQGLPNAPWGPQHCHLGIVLCKRDNKHVVELFWQLLLPPKQWPWGFHHSFFTFGSVSQFFTKHYANLIVQAYRKWPSQQPPRDPSGLLVGQVGRNGYLWSEAQKGSKARAKEPKGSPFSQWKCLPETNACHPVGPGLI